MADPGKQVTVSISKLVGFLDGVLSNAQKAKDELETAKKARAQAGAQDSIFMKLAKSALSGGVKK
jgi:hypothetical protein